MASAMAWARSLLGMPQNADWALVTCVSDKTCLRNALTYAIGQELAGAARCAGPRVSAGPRCTSTARINGVYLVAEKPKDDKFRVNLPNAADGTPPGEQGFLISADGDCRAAYGFDPLDPTSEFLDERARMSEPPPGMSCAAPTRWSRATGAGDPLAQPGHKLTAAQRTYLPRPSTR